MSTRRILSCILLPAYLSSCTAWHVQSASPAQVVQEEQPSRIRVTTTSDSVVILQEPGVLGDTLVGFVKRDFSGAPDTASALKIPLADISHVALHKTNAGKSVLLGLGIVVGLVVVLSAAALAATCADDAFTC